jgi:radical SAM-linked protein
MIPLPRPVGVASEAETIVVEFEEPIDLELALDRLDRETPADLRMVSVRLLQPKEQLRPTQARYCLDVGHSRLADLDARIRRVIKADVLEVERPILKSKRTRTVDIRPYLLDIRVDGDAIEYTLRVTGTGTARPAEVAGLLGYDANAINHRIRRIEVRWQ